MVEAQQSYAKIIHLSSSQNQGRIFMNQSMSKIKVRPSIHTKNPVLLG